MNLQELAERTDHLLAALALEALNDDFAPWVVAYIDAQRADMYRTISSGSFPREESRSI